MENLQNLFSDAWAVNRRSFDNFMSVLLPCISKGNIAEAAKLVSVSKCTAQAYGPYCAETYELNDFNLPDNSVAVISLNGMLYSWETKWLLRKIDEAKANPKICGIVFAIDGPGGQSSGVDVAAKAIRECGKPTATVVTGSMMSAHFWLGTSADRTFIASPLNEVGCVGVIFEMYSFEEMYKLAGIDHRLIYADASDLKNKETRALFEDNDDSLIKAHADKIHKVFAADVALNLGIEHDPELPLFRGQTFMGDEAVAAGYIDQAGNIDEAVKWVLAKATSRKANQLY